mgnify:CR=1 FL=1
MRIMNKLTLSLTALLLLTTVLGTLPISIVKGENKASFSIIEWYTLPPAINWNPLAPQSPMNMLNGLVEPNVPLFVFIPQKGVFLPMLGKDFRIDPVEGYLEVTLWPDSYWYNGKEKVPFTAKDVWTFFMIQWKIFRNFLPWLKDVVIVDDYTIRFYFNESTFTIRAPLINDPSKVFEFSYRAKIYYTGIFQLLTWRITTPYRLFGKWAEMVADVPVGEVPRRFNLTDLQNEIYSLQIDTPWANGPFWPDPTTITTTGVKLYKNPGFRWAKYVAYEEGEVLFARTEEQTVAWMMEGRDVATNHGLSPMSLIAIDKSPGGVKIIYIWNFEIQGIWFNIAKYPFNITEVRQALTMLINATEAGNAFPPMFSLAYNDYITGQPNSKDLPAYIRENLYDWSYNPEKAYKLLEKVGFKRKNGKWYRPDGEPFRVEVLCVSAWSDWVALATNIVSQLRQHGIEAEVRAVDEGVVDSLWMNWDFDITLHWAIMNTLGLTTAYVSYLNSLYPSMNFAVSKFNYTWPVPLKNGTVIYVNPYFEQLRLQAFLPGTPEFWDALAKLAWFWNYYLPTVPLWVVRRSWQISIKLTNFAELFGKPTEMIEVAGYKMPYYGAEQSWILQWYWGMYSPTFWASYGILRPPETKQEWPPTTPFKDPLKMLPPEVKPIYMDEIIEMIKAAMPTPTVPVQAIMGLNETIAALNETVIRLSSEVATLSSTIKNIQSSIDEIRSSIGSLSSDISSLKSQISEVSKLSSVVSSIKSVAYAALGIAIVSLIVAIFIVIRVTVKRE